jgi:hypothetical protein
MATPVPSGRGNGERRWTGHRLAATSPRVGATLDLQPGQWPYQNRPLRLVVTGVRPEISRWYGGNRVWVYGAELDPAGQPAGPCSALVFCDAIPDNATDHAGPAGA